MPEKSIAISLRRKIRFFFGLLFSFFRVSTSVRFQQHPALNVYPGTDKQLNLKPF